MKEISSMKKAADPKACGKKFSKSILSPSRECVKSKTFFLKIDD